jgi:N,N'-diacetyllegionaminate synthase
MSSLRIGSREVGAGAPVFLVAEIGINHNGDMGLARAMIDAAVEAGADAVKFQNYRTEDFVGDRALTYTYVSQGKTITEPQLDLFKRCELTRAALRELKVYCDERGIVFHSTPTSPDGIRDLVEIGAPVLKNGSDYLTHLPMVRAMGATGLPTVLSTGMATLAEIDEAVRAFRQTGNERLILLQCTSSYPTPPEDVHLRKIPALAAAFGCAVGLSDHTVGIVAALGAVVLGACWIEKHFTVDKHLAGPDHRFSADPAELRSLVESVRTLEKCLGNPPIGPTAREAQGRRGFRLSCTAARALSAGTVLGSDDLAFRRPGTGLPPSQAHLLIGRALRHDVEPGHVIELGELE